MKIHEDSLKKNTVLKIIWKKIKNSRKLTKYLLSGMKRTSLFVFHYFKHVSNKG